MTAALRLAEVCAGYGGSQVLSSVSLHVAPGEIVALVGRNGVGKSTAAATIAGTLPLSAGAVLLGATDVSSRRPSARYAAGLRVIRQDQPVLAGLTVAENLALVGCRDVGRAAHSFGFLTGRGGQLAGTLSGGEKKMLALARTALAPGSVWVVDEPTEGLQPGNVGKCAELLVQAAARGAAVLLVEQHLDMALAVSSRWYLMEKGRVVDEGTVSPDTRELIAGRLAV